MSKTFEFEYTGADGLAMTVKSEMTEDQILDLVRPMAAQVVLQAVKALQDHGFDAREAFRLGAYLVLRQAYGREWVRKEFALAHRTEVRWSGLVHDALEAMDEPTDEEALELAQRAAAAFTEQRARERAEGE